MGTQATGTFTVAGWDESTYAELGDGGKLTKAHVTFGFDGDLKAEGGWEAVMCYRAEHASLQGREGVPDDDEPSALCAHHVRQGTLDDVACGWTSLGDGAHPGKVRQLLRVVGMPTSDG